MRCEAICVAVAVCRAAAGSEVVANRFHHGALVHRDKASRRWTALKSVADERSPNRQQRRAVEIVPNRVKITAAQCQSVRWSHDVVVDQGSVATDPRTTSCRRVTKIIVLDRLAVLAA